MSESEQQLIARCQAGDRRAFELLVSRYERKVFGVAFGIARNPEDAMDLCQETFLRAWRNMGRFKGESRFYTWVYRIAVNVALDFVNKRKRETTVEHDESIQTEPQDYMDWPTANADRHNPAKRLAEKELGDVVGRALGKLSPKHRAVLVMREVEDLTYEEIAASLDISIGTVMSRLYHARQNMQKLLQGYLNEE